jgi:DNA polymerase III alpha subunit
MKQMIAIIACGLFCFTSGLYLGVQKANDRVAELGEKYNYDILAAVHESFKTQAVGDDNRKLFTDKRFSTFRKKYDPYKNIYEMNKTHIKYANWFFEEKLLGYSYSYNVRQVFNHEDDFHSSEAIKDRENRSNVKFVGSVVDIIRRTSRNNNKYARMQLQDECGVVNGLFLDGEREARLTNYLDSGKKLPKKGEVVIIYGSKGDDVVFIDKIFPLKDKIYMKLSELK